MRYLIYMSCLIGCLIAAVPVLDQAFAGNRPDCGTVVNAADRVKCQIDSRIVATKSIARKAATTECSEEADAKGLHGEERKKFRSECKKAEAPKFQ